MNTVERMEEDKCMKGIEKQGYRVQPLLCSDRQINE
jgi:hypothetical protein